MVVVVMVAFPSLRLDWSMVVWGAANVLLGVGCARLVSWRRAGWNHGGIDCVSGECKSLSNDWGYDEGSGRSMLGVSEAQGGEWNVIERSEADTRWDFVLRRD